MLGFEELLIAFMKFVLGQEMYVPVNSKWNLNLGPRRAQVRDHVLY